MRIVFIFLLFLGTLGSCAVLKDSGMVDLSNGRLEKYSFNMDKKNDIISLNLSNNQLEDIPDFVFELKNLKILSLSNNNIDSITSNICELEFLSTLNLSDNNCKGVFKSVSTLENLRVIFLLNNPHANEEYEEGKCLVNDSCLIVIHHEFIEYPPYCKDND